jgi:pimeloyl-ACP methyl ester carboxylesterase
MFLKSMFAKTHLYLVLPGLLFLLAACQAPNTAVPRFERGDCPFDKPQGMTVDCGYLVVPEVRSGQPTSGAATPAAQKTIRLAVAIFKSTASNPAPDPIVYLEGGPGASPLRGYAAQANLVFGPFLAQRDLILVDQRGTGYSEPALDCPELSQAEVDALPLDLSAVESDQRQNAAFLACRDRLVKAGANLAAFSSAESAADFNDLRQLLGYSTWNLYGISYGTRLALTIERDFPQGLRSVVIDSVLAPQADLIDTQPDNTSRALNQLFDACTQDAVCNKAYPNLRSVFFDTANKLNQAPVKVKVTLPDVGIADLTGKQTDLLINGDGFISAIFQSLYITSYLPDLPQVIYQASQGNLDPVAQTSMLFMASEKDISWGMYASVQCYEEVPFASPDKLAAEMQAHPELGGSQGTVDGTFALCKGWNVPPAPPLEDQAVKSDVPTLVLSGQFDPVTPPAWGKLVASTLSKSTYVELPAAGHGASLSEACPRRLALAYFDSPAAALDTSCTQKMGLSFSVPGQKVDVTLAPFDSSVLGISGQVPANWRTLSGVPGFYSPNGDVNDPEQLIIEAAPMAPDQVLEQFNSQFSAQGVIFAPTGKQHASPALTFTLYTASYGLTKIDLALAGNSQRAYVVLLQSPLSEHDGLYAAVFLPVIDALRPK